MTVVLLVGLYGIKTIIFAVGLYKTFLILCGESMKNFHLESKSKTCSGREVDANLYNFPKF